MSKAQNEIEEYLVELSTALAHLLDDTSGGELPFADFDRSETDDKDHHAMTLNFLIMHTGKLLRAYRQWQVLVGNYKHETFAIRDRVLPKLNNLIPSNDRHGGSSYE